MKSLQVFRRYHAPRSVRGSCHDLLPRGGDERVARWIRGSIRYERSTVNLTDLPLTEFPWWAFAVWLAAILPDDVGGGCKSLAFPRGAWEGGLRGFECPV
jgi:hypothetical protein